MSAVLNRATFKTSRLLEFCSEKELVAQTGHDLCEWPLVALKELVDNGIDATEEAGIQPQITVSVTADAITISDNGLGIPASTVEGVLDFSSRTSSREAYVSPTRGAQGNALKTVVAMPFVLDGTRGCTEIEASGMSHLITFSVDHIRQTPVVEHLEETGVVKNGTTVRVRWPNSPRSNLTDEQSRFLQQASGYVWLNPHVGLNLDWNGARVLEEAATDPGWRKWKPSDPTSAHWYTSKHLERLIAAYVSMDADNRRDNRTVREFVAEFRGISGSAKQKLVLEATELSRAPISTLVKGGKLDSPLIEKLLSSMKENSAPVKPEQLGVIGKDHFARRFAATGCHMESFEYRRIAGTEDGVPWVVEAAFGWCPRGGERRLVTGVNWSPAIGNPFRRLGPSGNSLDTALANCRVDPSDPVVLVLHLACPRVEYTDRGKSALLLSREQAIAILTTIAIVTKKWTKQRKREERNRSATANRQRAMSARSLVTIKDAAWQYMRDAYLKASANGTLPANARQIMYAARPYIQKNSDYELGKDFDKYFTQTLLPDYIAETGASWNVVFDARGHLTEPHTDRGIDLGTLQVRKYLSDVRGHKISDPDFDICESHFPTSGPQSCFGAILFIEKEGFLPLFRHAKLAERYDIAIMSTKGMSVTASRQLVESLCSDYKIPLLVLHDFDISGFTIFGTLRDSTRRFAYSRRFDVIDLGMRIGDIEDLQAESAGVSSPGKVRATLQKYGASESEIEFLVRQGRRVELNAFTSDAFVIWIERKLKEHGVKKVVPDDATLGVAFQRMRRQALVQKQIDALIANLGDDCVPVPDDLQKQIAERLERDPAASWDEVLCAIARDAGALQ